MINRRVRLDTIGMSSKSKGKRRAAKPYTKGELNKFIDSVCHPLCKSQKGFILVDGLLHALVEQNPPESVKKFIKYNLPRITEQIRSETEEKHE